MDNVKPNFKLPTTKMCVVKYFDPRTNKLEEVLIDTPANSPALIHKMLMSYKVGFSQIRAVKAVEAGQLFGQQVGNRVTFHNKVDTNRLEPMFA